MRRCLCFVGLMFWASSSWALTEIQALEKALIEKGESVEVILNLSQAYADAGDAVSAQVYLDYAVTLMDALPENEREKWASLVLDMSKQISLDSPQSQKTSSSSLQSLASIAVGFDSNANRGVSLDSLDLMLDSGETLVLQVDESAQKNRSAYTSLGWMGFQPTKTQQLNFHHGVEWVQYLNSNVASYYLVRTGLEYAGQSVTAFHYKNNQSINGVLLSGKKENWRGAYRWQTDRSVAQLGWTHSWESSVSRHSVGVWAEKDSPRIFRSGGESNRQKLTYQYQRKNWTVGYRYERSRDEDVYSALFYPGVKDAYSWHSVSVERSLGHWHSMLMSVKAQYDRKDARIPLNDWAAGRIELVGVKVF